MEREKIECMCDGKKPRVDCDGKNSRGFETGKRYQLISQDCLNRSCYFLKWGKLKNLEWYRKCFQNFLGGGAGENF